MAAGVAFTLLPCCARAQATTTIYFSANDVIATFTPPGPKTNFATLPFGTNPEGLVFDTSGNLFVAGGGNVTKITPGGTVSLVATLPSSAGGYGMTIDSNNNLYVADSFLGQISKITPGGVVSNYKTMSGPLDLTFDAIGNLYVVVSGSIQVIAPGGGTVSTYAALPGHVNTYGLAFDTAGYLYVPELTSTTLLKIAPGGGSYTNFGTLSSGPKGLAFDHNGNLYATQPYEDKISVITPDGTTSTFATGLSGPRYLTSDPGTTKALRITAVERFGNDLRLSYTSLAGMNCAVQSRADLSSGAWAMLPGTTNIGTGSTLQQTLTNAFTAPQQYYRVQQSP